MISQSTPSSLTDCFLQAVPILLITVCAQLNFYRNHPKMGTNLRRVSKMAYPLMAYITSTFAADWIAAPLLLTLLFLHGIFHHLLFQWMEEARGTGRFARPMLSVQSVVFGFTEAFLPPLSISAALAVFVWRSFPEPRSHPLFPLGYSVLLLLVLLLWSGLTKRVKRRVHGLMCVGVWMLFPLLALFPAGPPWQAWGILLFYPGAAAFLLIDRFYESIALFLTAIVRGVRAALQYRKRAVPPNLQFPPAASLPAIMREQFQSVTVADRSRGEFCQSKSLLQYGRHTTGILQLDTQLTQWRTFLKERDIEFKCDSLGRCRLREIVPESVIPDGELTRLIDLSLKDAYERMTVSESFRKCIRLEFGPTEEQFYDWDKLELPPGYPSKPSEGLIRCCTAFRNVLGIFLGEEGAEWGITDWSCFSGRMAEIKEIVSKNHSRAEYHERGGKGIRTFYLIGYDMNAKVCVHSHDTQSLRFDAASGVLFVPYED